MRAGTTTSSMLMLVVLVAVGAFPSCQCGEADQATSTPPSGQLRQGVILDPPFEVEDIAPPYGPSSSDPSTFFTTGNTTWFRAWTPATGAELWRFDPNSGPQLVADIRPGADGSGPFAFAELGGILYFFADDGIHGEELWRSDGTAAGTWLVKDVWPGMFGESAGELVVNQGVLYFGADDGTHGRELWRSDGTAAGTVLVADIRPGFSSSMIDPRAYEDGTSDTMKAVGGVLYFAADDGVHGNELWRVTATGGVLRLSDFVPGPSRSKPRFFFEYQGVLYLNAIAPGVGDRLFRTDGTVAGTVQLPSPRTPRRFTIHDGDLYFEGTDASGPELWRYDGTSFFQVIDLNPGGLGSGPRFLRSSGPWLYFKAYEPTMGNGMWRTDGTAAETVRLCDAIPSQWPPPPEEDPIAFDGRLFFTNLGPDGYELWVSDGTPAGSHLFADIFAGTGSSNPQHKFVRGTELYFAASDPGKGREIWRTDGTLAGLQLAHDVNPHPMAEARIKEMRRFADRVVFSALDPAGEEPWISDGTQAGTFRLADIVPGSSSWPVEFTKLGDEMVFSAFGPPERGGREAWITDGTFAGTRLLKDPELNPESLGALSQFTWMGGTLLFNADTGDKAPATGAELWRTDGTPDGTFQVKDIWPGTEGSSPFHLKRMGLLVYFSATDGNVADGGTGRELWVSDGTEYGTRLFSDINPSGWSQIERLIVSGDTLYFIADDGVHGRELFVTKGPGTGAKLLADLGGPSGYPPADPTLVRGQIDVDGTLYFVASDGTDRSLWKSDGTTAGTVKVATINPIGDAAVVTLGSLNGVLYFSADDGVHGSELWRTDGTAAGTAMVIDLLPGPAGSYPRNLWTAEGSVYFSATDGVTGHELWVTDGTAAGTSQVADIHSGPLPSDPGPGIHAGSHLFFTANGGANGRELWAVPVTPLQDTTAPKLVCPADVEKVTFDPAGTVVAFGLVDASDDQDEGVKLTWSHPSGGHFPVGVTTVEVTATDFSGNTSTCTFDVEVVLRDFEDPVLSCPKNVKTTTSASNGGIVDFPPATATDNITAEPEITYSHPPGSRFPVGETTVTVTARDEAANYVICKFLVTVEDDVAPQVDCPASIEVETTNEAGLAVSYDPAIATDDATAHPSLTYSEESGSVFPMGTTQVQVTAEDDSENQRSCWFLVTVRKPVEQPADVQPGGCGCSAKGGSGAQLTWLLWVSLLAVAWPRARAPAALIARDRRS